MSVLLSMIQTVEGIRHEVGRLNMSPSTGAATKGESDALVVANAVDSLIGQGGILASLESDPFDAGLRGDLVSYMAIATGAADDLAAALLDFQEKFPEPDGIAGDIISFAGVMQSLFAGIESEVSSLPGGAGFIAARNEFGVVLGNLTDAYVALKQTAEQVAPTTTDCTEAVGLLSAAVDAFLLEESDPAQAEELRAAAQAQAEITTSRALEAVTVWNLLKNLSSGFPEKVQLLAQTAFYKSEFLASGIALAESLIEEIDQFLADGPNAVQEVLRAVGGIVNAAVLQDVANQMRTIIQRLSRA